METQTPYQVGYGSPSQTEELQQAVRAKILDVLSAQRQPSAGEMLRLVEQELGWRARWCFLPAVRELREDHSLQRYLREYLTTALSDEEVSTALRGEVEPQEEHFSTLDELFRRSAAYRQSAYFHETIEFTAKFREYAPFNNMLVKLQRPSCSFYATETHWRKAFQRKVKEDARPILILAPMHPVMLVYDLDDTEGPPLPEQLRNFARTEGEWNPAILNHTLENAARDRILVQFKPLSSTHAGFATSRLGDGEFKMRVVVHEPLDPKSRYTTLLHELAHIYLGHLGSDKDRWWPCRINLSHAAVEIEAEAVAYIVGLRAGLRASSEAYLSSYIKGAEIPPDVSLELIVKVAGRLEEMGRGKLPPRKTAEKP